MKARPPKKNDAPPDQIKLTSMQAQRLAAMSDLQADALTGLTVAEIGEKFRFRIDPLLLFFRRVCGRVVKKDPVTGVEYPVPNATVMAEDTDCSLLGYFPIGYRWGWHFPLRCRREVIATAVTDECGRFCIWIPRWDIDWILRFRRERFCFPIIFDRPTLRDILEDVIPGRPPIPIPEPDPPPFGFDASTRLFSGDNLGSGHMFNSQGSAGASPLSYAGAGRRPCGGKPCDDRNQDFDRGRFMRLVEESLGREASFEIDRLGSEASLGRRSGGLIRTLDAPAFPFEVPPPLPREFRTSKDSGQEDRAASARAASASGSGAASAGSDAFAGLSPESLSARLGIHPEQLRGFDPRRYLGPFRRCFDFLIPEWVPIIDIPDITFKVTQDVDLDGDEETIYSEGFFRVRWNSGPIGDLTIYAQPHARASLECGSPDVPCGNVPAIVLAGRMPVVGEPTIYDPSSGYALRPNRPHPSGLFADPLPNPPAASPFMGAVSLLGCVKVPGNATHYRVVYKYSSDQGATFTSFAPFVGLTWPLFRLDGGGNSEWHYPTSDANGWYPIDLPPGPNPFLPQNLLLDWPTYAFANGRYVLKVEIGTGGVASATSAEVAFNVDNSAPRGPLTVEWRKVGGGVFQPLLFPCPLVRRGATPVAVEFRVTLDASASHLRSAIIYGQGCGSGDLQLMSGTTEHWHTAPSDNAVLLQGIYRLEAGASQGTYGFWGHVSSRAFNPNGGDGGHLILPDPWEYNPDVLHIYPSFSFSVIDAD